MMTTMTTTALAGAAILAVAGGVSLLLGKASASLRHLVWTTALAATLALPVLEASGVHVEVTMPGWLSPSVVPAPAPRSSAERPVERAAIGAAENTSSRSVRTAPVVAQAPAPARAAGRAEAPVAVVSDGGDPRGSTTPADVTPDRGETSVAVVSDRGGPRRETSADVVPADDGAVAAATASGVSFGTTAGRAGSAGAWIDSPFSLGGVASAVWLLGSLVLLAGALFAQLAAHRVTTRGVRAADPIARGRLAVLAYESGIRRPVRLVVSRSLSVPATWGLGTSTIVLPEQYVAWSPRTLDRVLLHELAHIHRKDCWTLLLGELARAVHWPNPYVWMAVRSQRLESERACDDRVLARGDVASDYAQDLVVIARSVRAGIRPPQAVLAIAGPSGVASRIRSILDPGRARGRVGSAAVVAAMLLAIAVPFSATALVPVAADQAVDIELPTPPTPSHAPIVAAVPGHVLAYADDPGAVVHAVEPPLPEPPPMFTGGIRAAAPWATPASAASAPDPLWSVSGLLARFSETRQTQEHCVFRDGERRSTSYNVDDDEYRIRWETDSCRVEIDMEGVIDFDADDTGVARMADGALFEIEERVGRATRRARLEGTRGDIERRYWVDGDAQTWGADADRWLAGLLPEIFRHTTINARPRVQRMLAAGGPDAVFAEVERGRSEHVQRTYLELMIELADLGERDYARIIDMAGRFESDHSSSELLLAVVARAGLRPAFQEPMLRAAASIESDHQKARVLAALLESPLSPEQLDAVVVTARDIDSDHQLAEVLSTVARQGGLSAAGRTSFMETLGSIESDHQHVTVLDAFLDQGTLSADELSQVLAMARGIDSDHQRAQVLERVARDYPLTGDQVTAYLRAAAEIDSDHQTATVAKVVIERADFTDEHVEMVLAMTDRVGSDHQRAEILSAVVERRELSPYEIGLVLASARAISSDHQLSELLVLLLSDEELDEEGVLAVVDAARAIGSDHNQSTVLTRLAERHEIDGEALGLYRELAEGMSRHQRDQTLAAIARRPMR